VTRAELVFPNEAKQPVWTRRRVLAMAAMVLLTVIGIPNGVLVGTRDVPPDPTII
jgi:hypothetical protein